MSKMALYFPVYPTLSKIFVKSKNLATMIFLQTIW